MKKLSYLLLIGVIVAGLTVTGTGKAEAMDNGSAALVAGTVALIGGAVMYAAMVDADHHRPVYVGSYPAVTYSREVYRPVRTEVIYVDHDRRDSFQRHSRQRDGGYYRSDRGWRHDYGRH